MWWRLNKQWCVFIFETVWIFSWFPNSYSNGVFTYASFHKWFFWAPIITVRVTNVWISQQLTSWICSRLCSDQICLSVSLHSGLEVSPNTKKLTTFPIILLNVVPGDNRDELSCINSDLSHMGTNHIWIQSVQSCNIHQYSLIFMNIHHLWFLH